MRRIDFIDNFVVKAFCRDDTAVELALGQQVIADLCRERTEQVAGTEVQPGRFSDGLCDHGGTVICGECDAGSGKCSLVGKCFFIQI